MFSLDCLSILTHVERIISLKCCSKCRVYTKYYAMIGVNKSYVNGSVCVCACARERKKSFILIFAP